MKKIIGMAIWVICVCVAIMYGLQMINLISMFWDADVIDFYDYGIRTIFVDEDVMHYMPWKWLAWTLFQKPAIGFVLIGIGKFIEEFNVKVERAA